MTGAPGVQLPCRLPRCVPCRPPGRAPAAGDAGAPDPELPTAVPEKQLREDGVFDEYRELNEAEGA
ncbi:hypothetical protein [Streptomyces sp. NPDC059272]|uniref:hypothetical protein n=1 Tax=Streptomyces sp. NPDC059272 TaxID=3346800 RepID=UPI00368BEE01